jgi:two-component system LytT family sensor kinase
MILDMDATRDSSRPAWFWIACIWAAAALFDATQTVFGMRAMGMHHAWTLLFLTVILQWLPWSLSTPLVLHLGRRYPPVRLRPLSTWLVHAVVATAIHAVSVAWTSCLEVLFNPYALPKGPGEFSQLWTSKFYNGMFAAVVLYAIILTAGHLIESSARLSRQQTETARLSEQLSRSRFDALQRQIEPHFLFNTLHSIAGLVRENRNDAAVTMIARLSEFLRRVIEDSSHQLASLADEMAFLEQYLEIQKVRFADRLQVSVDIPRELLPAPVPTLMLQPMVENAIKHGIGKRVQGGAIRISASRRNGTLTISVYNDGPGLPANWDTHGSGVGLSNVRARLQSLYGDGFGLTMHDRAPGGVEVLVSVPVKEG